MAVRVDERAASPNPLGLPGGLIINLWVTAWGIIYAGFNSRDIA